MSEPTYNYSDNSFNLHQAHHYTLLLQIDTTSFSYAVTYQQQLLTYAGNVALDELNNPGQLHDLLAVKYKTTIVGLAATGFTLVPKILYNREHVADFARFLDVQGNEKVFAQPFDDENNIIYKVEDRIVTIAEKFKLDNAVFSARGWVTAVKQSNPSASHLYLNVNKDKVEILHCSENKLQFYNCFEFKSEDELIYFAAMVANQLNLEPKEISLVLSGDVEADDKYIKRLSQFFAAVTLNDLEILHLPAQIPSHQILALAALSLCGSSEVY